MLGAEDGGVIKTKACETKDIVPCCVRLLRSHEGAMGSTASHMIVAGEVLLEYVELCSSCPRVADDVSLVRMVTLVKRFVRLYKLAEFPEKPKLHLFIHLVQRTRYNGNADHYATFADEGLNAVVAEIARHAHRMVWTKRVYAWFDQSENDRIWSLKRQGKRLRRV